MNEEKQATEERQTAWEIMRDFFQDKKEKPQELQIFNPLGLKIGDFVSIDIEGLFGEQFPVTEIRENTTGVGEKDFVHTDFVLATEGDETVYLRLNPVVNSDPYAKKHCDMLVLFPDAEMRHDEDFYKNTLSTGILEVNEDGVVIATYERIRKKKDPFQAIVKVVDKQGQPPRVERISYWDYDRDTEDGTKEFYFVEMNEETGFFKMFRGVPVFEESVKFLRKKVGA